MEKFERIVSRVTMHRQNKVFLLQAPGFIHGVFTQQQPLATRHESHQEALDMLPWALSLARLELGGRGRAKVLLQEELPGSSQ